MAIETANEEYQRRAGKNQALFRDVNERVNEINQAHDLWLTLSDWVCECADETCTERIELTPEDYERVRENPTRFVVAGSEEHVVPGAERIVEQHPRYWVVEKVGEAAAAAEELDPRGSDRKVR
jgi:hypothetical protein